MNNKFAFDSLVEWTTKCKYKYIFQEKDYLSILTSQIKQIDLQYHIKVYDICINILILILLISCFFLILFNFFFQAIALFNESGSFHEGNKDEKNLAASYTNIALCYMYKQNFKRSLEYNWKALAVCYHFYLLILATGYSSAVKAPVS